MLSVFGFLLADFGLAETGRFKAACVSMFVIVLVTSV
jgi:hypothetical protein